MGPTVSIPESPLEVFELFFSDDLLDIIVEESNGYAGQVMGEGALQGMEKHHQRGCEGISWFFHSYGHRPLTIGG